MRYVKKELLLKLLVTLMVLLLATFALGATMQEVNDVKYEVKQECTRIRRNCYLTINYSDMLLNAYVGKDNEIIISRGIADSFNKGELLAVAMHEVGHVKYKHREQLDYYMAIRSFMLTNKAYRHDMEYKADRFACDYFLRQGSYNYLPDALKNLNRADMNKESITHPSLNNRIKKAIDYSYKKEGQYAQNKI